MLFVAFPLLLLIFSLIFNFCHFDYSVLWCIPLWVNPVWDSLHFLVLGDYFLPQIREVFSYCLFKYVFRPFLSPPFGTPIMRILARLMLSQRSAKLSLFLFILLSFFCSGTMISTILSSSSVIYPSASVSLLLIPSSVFFISVIVFFILFGCSLYILILCLKLLISHSVRPFS